MADVTARSLQLPSLRVHLLEAGAASGPLVVLLHGFPELSESWREVLVPLARAGFHAVAPDLRGYGGTDVTPGGYDLDTLAGDVAELLGHLQPGRPAHLVGHDWGGAIAYRLAATRPALVDRLAVVNCPHPALMARRMWRPGQLVRSAYMLYFQLPRWPERALGRDGGRAVPRLIRRAMVDPGRAPEARLAPYAANFARPGRARAALAYYRTALRGLLTPRGAYRALQGYPRIRAPFRLIWAEEDVALGRHLTQGLEPYFEHPPEVCFLPGVGHFAPLEAPQAVARLLLEHLGPACASAPRGLD